MNFKTQLTNDENINLQKIQVHGQMTKQFKAYADLAEDRGSVPTTNI